MVAEVYVHSDNHMVVRCMLQGCKLDAADTAVVSSDILQVKFTAADLQSVLMELSPESVVSGGGQKRRRAGQSYEALRNYLTDEEWHVLSADGDNGPKLDVLVAASIALGCRCPTEPSLKLLASLWLMTSTSDEVCGVYAVCPERLPDDSVVCKHSYQWCGVRYDHSVDACRPCDAEVVQESVSVKRNIAGPQTKRNFAVPSQRLAAEVVGVASSDDPPALGWRTVAGRWYNGNLWGTQHTHH